MELTEAVTAFLKARNALRRTLVEIVSSGEKMIFRHTDHDHHVIVSEELKVVNIDEKTTIVCLNTTRNLQFLVDNWESFLQPKLSVLFMNPQTQEQWKVMPVAHHAVADPKKLRAGLESLFSQVSEV